MSDIRASGKRFTGNAAEWASVKFLAGLPEQLWPWLVSAVEVAVLLVKQQVFSNFQLCKGHATNEALKDIHQLAKTKPLTRKATTTMLLGKVSTTPANNLFNHYASRL